MTLTQSTYYPLMKHLFEGSLYIGTVEHKEGHFLASSSIAKKSIQFTTEDEGIKWVIRKYNESLKPQNQLKLAI